MLQGDGGRTESLYLPIRHFTVTPRAMREVEWKSRKHVSTLRRNLTTAEAKLWQDLRSRRLQGYKFRRQHPIEDYVADFVCLSVKLVIEIDGATHSTNEELAYDAQRTEVLEGLGWRVIRFTNDEVYGDVDGVIEAIWDALKNQV
ncbi:endonuclease domain-containing protein [Hellea balneolensis]|uniref:endonuclease domain-containing protein n=1 Tax=Hellea balneolensis TaxID=287478 RepID=UPI000418B0FF|nr:endonuclease domain-containing protein [Hellea balneolensis]